ncbi:hypothetical protein JS87_23835, partial [Vibrio vulnificus]
MSVDCANISESWQDTFLLDDVGFGSVAGLLFIYNHDDKYDYDFSDLLGRVDFREIPLLEDKEIVVMGPHLIKRLYDVVSDMQKLKADDSFPSPKDFTF